MKEIAALFPVNILKPGKQFQVISQVLPVLDIFYESSISNNLDKETRDILSNLKKQDLN